MPLYGELSLSLTIFSIFPASLCVDPLAPTVQCSLPGREAHMRDSIIMTAVFAGLIVGGILQLRRPTSNTPPHHKGEMTRTAPFHRNQGDPHERTTREQARPAEVAGTGEGNSGEADEASSVPSIYSQSSTAESPARVSKRKSLKRSAIGGIDADSYVASQRNGLRGARVTANSGEGLRVFLMCMEVKGNVMESETERDCRALYRDSLALKTSQR